MSIENSADKSQKELLNFKSGVKSSKETTREEKQLLLKMFKEKKLEIEKCLLNGLTDLHIFTNSEREEMSFLTSYVFCVTCEVLISIKENSYKGARKHLDSPSYKEIHSARVPGEKRIIH